MGVRQLLQLPLVMTLLVVLGGCKGAKPPPTKETIKKVVTVLRGTGDDALRHQDEAVLKDTIVRSLEKSNSIKSADDLARAGRHVPVEEILQAIQRERSLRNKISGELDRIASNIDPSQPFAFGAAVVEAHCSGLKRELATGEPSTAIHYIIYLVTELAMNQLPTPPDKQIGEAAEDLVEVARGLYALTREDEAARRAYIKAKCKIT